MMRKQSVVILSLVTAIFSACHLRARSKVAERVTFHDNLNYSAVNSKDAGFDLYLPKGAVENTPAVVFIHGGYWRNQERSYYQAFTGLYQNFGLALASRGIATAVIDYRLYPQAKLEDQLDDVAAAVSYLKTHAGKYAIDPSQVFLAGHSAGGHLALMALWHKKNPDVKAVIALSPILDIAHMRQHKEPEFNRELTQPFFGNGENDGKYSPATYAVASARPALLLFGSNDYAYLVEQGKVHAAKFSAAGLTQVKIAWVQDADHSDMVMNVHTADDRVSDVIAGYVTGMKGQK